MKKHGHTQCWAVSGSVGQCRAQCRASVGQCWAVSGSVGQCQAVLGFVFALTFVCFLVPTCIFCSFFFVNLGSLCISVWFVCYLNGFRAYLRIFFSFVSF